MAYQAPAAASYTKLDVLQMTSFSDTTLWRRVRDGQFPAPIRVSPRRVVWDRAKVDRWMADRGFTVAQAS